MQAGMWVRVACAGAIVAALHGCGGGSSSPQTFTVGGTVSGAASSVVLQNNGAGNLTVNANGTFTFAGPLNGGAAYSVTVFTPPGLQACTVANGSGTVSANVTSVAVTCSNLPPPTLALTPAKTKLFRFAWNSVAGSTHYRLLEDPSGSAGFTQLGADIPATSTSVEQVTTLFSRFKARYIVQACAGTRCIDSNTVNVTGSLADAVGYFKASNPHPSGEFGISVALSTDGTTLAVGAPGERSAATGIDGDQGDAGVDRAGAVYVFTRAGNVWSQQAYVKASNSERGDEFGAAVALSSDGSILAVSADLEDSNATGIENDQSDNTAGSAGAVYVFSRSGVTWSQRAYIKASNTERGDRFGRRLALSGDGRTLAVSAPGEDSSVEGIDGDQTDNFAAASGAAYVFIRPVETDTWIQQAYVKASNTGEFDDFGESLALSADGRTLAVGASSEDSGATGIDGNQGDTGAPDSGAVYVFGRVDAVWSQQAYLKASNTEGGDRFGSAVALSADGSTLAVGASAEDGSGDAAGEGDNGAGESGAVYVFARSSNNVWAPSNAYLKASNVAADDVFGVSVALSADGRTLAVGASREDSNARGIGGDEANDAGDSAGAAYVFTRAGEAWTQQAYIKASNAGVSSGEIFGTAMALSGDATVLAVGALLEDGSSPGINGDENAVSRTFPGAVYLY